LIETSGRPFFATMAVALNAVQAGKIRVLAVTTAKRSDVLSGIPTVDEFVRSVFASAACAHAPDRPRRAA
jgi:tripartite-type tricarboxylate transporter receptor subunit TctC